MSSFVSIWCKHIASNYTSVMANTCLHMTGIERGRWFLASLPTWEKGNNGDTNADDEDNEFSPPLSITQSTPSPPVSSMQISTRDFFVFLKSMTFAATLQNDL